MAQNTHIVSHLVRPTYRQAIARLWKVLFLGFFALYAAAAIIWLAAGFAPFLVDTFPSLRETLWQWRRVDESPAWLNRVPLARMLVVTVADASWASEPPTLVIPQYLFSLLNLVLGIFLVWLRPYNRAARLLALGMVGTAAVFNLQAHAAEKVLPALENVHGPFHLISGIAYVFGLLYFPSGELSRRRSRPRRFTWPLRVAGILFLTFAGFTFNFNDGEPESLVMLFGVVIPLAGTVAQAMRSRQAATAEERQQSRSLMWVLVLAFGLALLWGLLLLSLEAMRPGLPAGSFAGLREFVFLVFPSLFAVIPGTLFVVMVRYHLWDIDGIINRTLVYALLTGALALLYIGTVLLFHQLLFGTITANRSMLVIIMSTLLIAALSQPLRRRLQTFVDRRFYREKVDFRQAFTDFAGEVRTIIELQELVRVLVDRTTGLLHVAHAAVFLRGADGRFHLAEASKRDQRHPAGQPLRGPILLLEAATIERLQAGVVAQPKQESFPLLVPLRVPRPGGSDLVGVLALGPRLSGQGYSYDDHQLLMGLADQAGTAIRVAQLIDEKQAEAQRREETERSLLAYRHSPAGRAEVAAQAILAQPDLALAELHRLAQQAGSDAAVASLLDHLPTALGNLGAPLLAGLAEGYHFVCFSLHTPALLPVGLRAVIDNLQLAEAEAIRGRTGALLIYGRCREAFEADSIAQIVELVGSAARLRMAPGDPPDGADGHAPFLAGLQQALVELEAAADTLRAAERVDTPADKLTYLAGALDRINGTEHFARTELGSADRPIVERVAERWRNIITGAMRELQTTARLTCRLLTRNTWRGEVIVLPLSVRNVGRGAALNLRVGLEPGPEYTVLQTAATIARLGPGEEVQVELRVRPCGEGTPSLKQAEQRPAPGADQFRARFVLRYVDLPGSEQTEYFADTVFLLEAQEPFQFIPNPYVVGTPLHTGSPLFFGREDLVAFIQENLQAAHRNSLVLVGQQRTGKTSLLKQLRARLGEAYLPVYLDGQAFGLDPGLPNFCLTLATEIAFALEDSGFSIELPELQQFADSPAATFERRFLPRVRDMLGERHLLLLLDEFEELEAAVRRGTLPPSIFGFLRHLLQHAENLSMIFCGTHRLEELDVNHWSMLFNISLYRQVGLLERSEATRLIVEPVAPFGMRYDDLALEKIWGITAGHPYFLQILCHSLVQRHNATRRSYVGVDDVNAALEEMLAWGQAHFTYLWLESTAEERLVLVALSRMLSLTGRAGPVEVVDYLAERGVALGRSAASEALHRLALREILTASQERDVALGEEYRWQLGVLGLWVEKYQPLSRIVAEVAR
ncbi:MAG TPA: AAA family ATPase [Herpetosiphonaceae bacterium]|nr:AAA family ATPase [Herpetosiphonaceae bacterium]